MERAKEGRIGEDEFRTAVQRMTALHAQENTTIGEQAQQAALDELYGLGYDYHKTFDARIEAVTLKDVVEAARKYFGNHVLVTSSPERSGVRVNCSLGAMPTLAVGMHGAVGSAQHGHEKRDHGTRQFRSVEAKGLSPAACQRWNVERLMATMLPRIIGDHPLAKRRRTGS